MLAEMEQNQLKFDCLQKHNLHFADTHTELKQVL